MRYLITGATGNIGSRVTFRLMGRLMGHLIGRSERPRVLVRDAEKGRALFGNQVDIAVGNLTDERSMSAALAGIDALFLVSSGPGLAQQDALAAQAAKAAGVKRLVKLSSLGARAAGQSTAVAQWHADGEAAIEASGVPYTFIRSVGFMSNALGWARSIKTEGVVRASTGQGRIAMIHPEDIAAVAVEALVTDSYIGKALAITGPEALSYAEMVARIGVAAGKTLRFEPISDEQARANLLANGMPSLLADALVTLWREVREGQVATVTDHVERVTGRPPFPFSRWAEESAAEFR